jgi:hypothetical protein
MRKLLNRTTLQVSAAVTVGMMMSADPAHAQAAAGGTGNNFSTIASNVTSSIANLPGLLTGLSYMFGIMLGVLGILKIKDHVENPQQTPLKDGAIRLAAGGGLFALPMVYDAMKTTIGTSAGVEAANLNSVGFNVDTAP